MTERLEQQIQLCVFFASENIPLGFSAPSQVGVKSNQLILNLRLVVTHRTAAKNKIRNAQNALLHGDK